MTPRIRSIKPEAIKDGDLWDAEQETGLPLFRAFAGLWCCADREGRFEWKARELKLECLPWWDGDFSRVLDALAARGYLVRYTVEGREYGLVRNFLKHQHINNREAASKLPTPTKASIKAASSVRDDDASSARDSHVPDVTSLPFCSVPFSSMGGVGGEPPVEEPPEPDNPVELPTTWDPGVAVLAGTGAERIHDTALPRFRAHHCGSGVRKRPGQWVQGYRLWAVKDMQDARGRPSQARPNQRQPDHPSVNLDDYAEEDHYAADN